MPMIVYKLSAHIGSFLCFFFSQSVQHELPNIKGVVQNSYCQIVYRSYQTEKFCCPIWPRDRLIMKVLHNSLNAVCPTLCGKKRQLRATVCKVRKREEVIKQLCVIIWPIYWTVWRKCVRNARIVRATYLFYQFVVMCICANIHKNQCKINGLANQRYQFWLKTISGVWIFAICHIHIYAFPWQ